MMDDLSPLKKPSGDPQPAKGSVCLCREKQGCPAGVALPALWLRAQIIDFVNDDVAEVLFLDLGRPGLTLLKEAR